jgi:hypothetical protein
MGAWWERDVLDADKLPLMVCFAAFVLTFLVTRMITRLIRADRGPFRDNVNASGTHIHHAVPGLILLVVGAFTAVGAGSQVWQVVAGLMVGAGVSLVLDEFALILHLEDVYWSGEGRLSVTMISLTAGCLGLALVGLTPVGVDGVGGAELAVRVGASALVLVHFVEVLVCLLKGKYRLALFGIFLPPISLLGSLRLARPTSRWARRRYSERRIAEATRRSETFDRRWQPVLDRWDNLLGGAPSLPDPQRLPDPRGLPDSQRLPDPKGA